MVVVVVVVEIAKWHMICPDWSEERTILHHACIIGSDALVLPPTSHLGILQVPVGPALTRGAHLSVWGEAGGCG